MGAVDCIMSVGVTVELVVETDVDEGGNEDVVVGKELTVGDDVVLGGAEVVSIEELHLMVLEAILQMLLSSAPVFRLLCSTA